MDLSSIENLIRTNYSNISKQLDKVEEVISDLRKQMIKDHDTLILLDQTVKNLSEKIDENVKKEEQFGRQFSKKLDDFDLRVKKTEDYQIADITREQIEDAKKSVWKKLVPYVPWLFAALGIGGGAAL